MRINFYRKLEKEHLFKLYNVLKILNYMGKSFIHFNIMYISIYIRNMFENVSEWKSITSEQTHKMLRTRKSTELGEISERGEEYES